MMITQFKNRPWEQRYQKLGDEAETEFEQWANKHGHGFVRSGLSRPPFPTTQLSAFTMYTPDYLCEDGYHEVQGCGADQAYKFKDNKMEALKKWAESGTDVWIWLWNNTNGGSYCKMSLDQIRHLIFQFGQPCQFPEGKPYRRLDAALLPLTPKDW